MYFQLKRLPENYPGLEVTKIVPAEAVNESCFAVYGIFG